MPPLAPGAVPSGYWSVRPAATAREPWATRADLLLGVVVVAVLALVGVLAGWVWARVSLHGVSWLHLGPVAPARGYVLGPNAIMPGEGENFIAADARFAMIGAVLGVVAAVLVWLRAAWRGPLAALALAVGGLVGSLIADAVGRAHGGGQASGATNSVITLQLQVHARVLLLVQALVALFVYVMLTLWARRDDLGRAGRARAARAG